MNALKQAQMAANECRGEQGVTNGEDGNGEPKSNTEHPWDCGDHAGAKSPGVSMNGQTGPSPGTRGGGGY